jgi:hypothetical protein
MTALFRRIQPALKFRISKSQIAKFLKIPESMIVKIQSWRYVLFVHRRDKGGQFLSYRQLEQWKNAVACQMQKCVTWQQLKHLWNAIVFDHKKHQQQYNNSSLPFLEDIRDKCEEAILNNSATFNQQQQENSHPLEGDETLNQKYKLELDVDIS